MDSACKGFQALPRVKLSELTGYDSAEQYFLAAEKLNLGLCKHNVCILQLGPEGIKEIGTALACFATLFAEAPQLLQPCRGVSEASPGYKTVPGRQKFEFRLGSSAVLGLPALAASLCEPAFHKLDHISRILVGAICRSHGVRLRSDTFSTLFDDAPTPPNTLSSSCFEVVRYCNNLPSGGAASSTGKPWSYTPQQEGMSHKGFLSIVAQREAQHTPDGCPVSRLQVKSALGSWTDVVLAADEVAVMFGHTACRASGGLFRPATYRVVGEVLGGTGRQSLEFQLHARPDAVVNFHAALEAAGHIVSDKFATPVSMKELMCQFDNVLTPVSQVRGSHNRSIEFNTLDTESLRKKSRKRMPVHASPVTRSGKVRRTGSGLVGQRTAAAAASYATAAELNAAQAALQAAEQRVYITVDGSNRNTDMFISVQISWPGLHKPVWLRVHPFQTCARVFEVYCQTMGANLNELVFTRKGQRVYGHDTFYDLHMQDEDEILVAITGQALAAPVNVVLDAAIAKRLSEVVGSAPAAAEGPSQALDSSACPSENDVDDDCEDADDCDEDGDECDEDGDDCGKEGDC